VAVVISLNRFLAPVDDTVTAYLKTQVTSHIPRTWDWRVGGGDPVLTPGSQVGSSSQEPESTPPLASGSSSRPAGA